MGEFEQQLESVRPGDFGIIGDPVAHSLSPAMQNAALGSGRRYHLFHVTVSGLPSALKRLGMAGIRGLNITVPHKQAAARLLGQMDAFASRVGAVNTVDVVSGKAVGYNTDGPGFGRALQNDLSFDPRGKIALVLGAGGTGAVLVWQLIEMGVRQVHWWNRSVERLSQAVKEIGSAAVQPVKRLSDVKADLVVNATSVGLKEGDGLPSDELRFSSGQVVMDTIYHRETEFIRQAKKAGARGAGGLPMLLYQGALAFEIWTKEKAPVAVMKTALIQTLEKKGQKVLWQFGT